MVSFGLEPSAGIWNALIKGYRKYGSLENALAVLTETCRKGS
jgi:pentatricopeptide repeat protein